MARWIRFFLAIAVGIAGGLFYGWWVNPVEYVNTSPDTLRRRLPQQLRANGG